MAGDLGDLIDTGKSPSRAESRAIAHLDDLWEEGRVHRERWAPQKQRDLNRKLYRGEVGPQGSKECKYKLNIAQAFTDRQVAQLTINRPINRIEARKAKERPIARVLQKISQLVWDDSDVQAQTTLVATNAALDGCAGMLTLYEPAEDTIRLKLVNIGDLSIDPAVTTAARVCTDAEYAAWSEIWPLSQIRQAFPGRGLLVKGDRSLDDLSPRKDTGSSSPGPVARWMRRQSEQSEGAVERAEVRTFFVKDRRLNLRGDPVFPTGRALMVAGDTVLWDGPNVYWDGEHPIDLFEWLPDVDHVFGHSNMELLRESQLAFNALMNGTVEARLLTNFMSIIADWNALDAKGWNALKGLSGANIFKTQVRGARFEIAPPPAIAQDAIFLAKQIFTYAQVVTGCTDTMLGENPGSLQSGAAIEGLQESASLMTAARQGRLENFYGRVGQKLVARSFQFMSSDRVAALIGDESPDTKNEGAEGGDLPDAVLYAQYRGGFTVDEKGRGVTPAARQRAVRDFKFGVVPGSSSPNARKARAAVAGELVRMGGLPLYMALEMADFPNARELAAEGLKDLMARAPLMAAMGKMSGG